MEGVGFASASEGEWETLRHWMIYIILYMGVNIFGLIPFRDTDVATLSPVQALWLAQEDGCVYMETDNGDIGIGKTVADALINMKETASGTVFLDTADFLIVRKGSEALIAQMREILRPSCSVCVAQSAPDLQTATDFMRIHKPSVKMKNTDAERPNLPVLHQEKGRLILVES